MSNHSYWSASVGYGQFVVDSYVYVSDNLHQLRTEYKFPQQFFEDVITVTRNNKDPLMFICITMFAVGWTTLRNAFRDYLIKPIGEKYELPLSEQEKLSESAWKFVFYFSSWLLETYILIVKEKGVPLLRPELILNDWQFTNEIPIEYHILYVVQLSFYLHSIYATIAMDCWRKDSIVQLIHHVIAICLIFSGFSTHIHQVGAVILFLHDFCDVFLEGAKSALYFKTQGKRKYPIFELIANVSFVLFTLVWFCSRLYAFPLRLISYCITPSKRPLSFLINVMLYLLLMMNLYWFTFILKLIYKIATGTDELADLREYEKETQLDDMASDLNENQPIYSSEDLVNKNDAIESTKARHNNLRKRSHVGVRSN